MNGNRSESLAEKSDHYTQPATLGQISPRVEPCMSPGGSGYGIDCNLHHQTAGLPTLEVTDRKSHKSQAVIDARYSSPDKDYVGRGVAGIAGLTLYHDKFNSNDKEIFAFCHQRVPKLESSMPEDLLETRLLANKKAQYYLAERENFYQECLAGVRRTGEPPSLLRLKEMATGCLKLAVRDGENRPLLRWSEANTKRYSEYLPEEFAVVKPYVRAQAAVGLANEECRALRNVEHLKAFGFAELLNLAIDEAIPRSKINQESAIADELSPLILVSKLNPAAKAAVIVLPHLLTRAFLDK